MRIGIEFAKVSSGGGERILYMLAESFARRGYSIVVFTWNEKWLNSSIAFPHELCVLKHSPNWGKGLRSILELSHAVKKYDVDCLVAFLNTSLRVFIGAAKLNHIPIITSLRVEPIFNSFFKKLMKVMMWCCDGIVLQTQTVRNSFKGRILKCSTVIPNPIMDDNLPFVSFDKRQKEIVGIGRLTEQKNFALLIDTFADLRPQGYVLKIYGEGYLRDSLQDRIDELGLNNQVFLMGHVDRVVEYIANAEVFVLSSDWEGMPNALMEAMAMGLACVATDVATGGCRDLINHGINGLLTPIGHKASLKKYLQLIIENESLKKQLMSNGMKIRVTHSKDVIIPQWISFIESMVNKKQR